MMQGLSLLRNSSLVVLLFISCLLPGLSPAVELNLAPDCSNAVAAPASLWPVNHKFVDIDISGATDPDNDSLAISVQCILQDEELNATGDGNFTYDADGINTPTASVRSERSGNNNGRVYHIDFIATDSNGARCGGEVTVSVPHDIKNPAIDEGRLFKSVPSQNICGLHDINNPPWIYSDPIVTGTTYEVYQYDVNGHDPDQDVLGYSIVNGPSGLVIDHVSGLLTWTAPVAGIYSVTVRIEDGHGGSDEQVYTLNIIPIPTVTLTAGAEEIKSGETTTLTWTSTNADTLSIKPGIGTVEQSGITSVSPADTTTYTITASGRGGTATASVTITVSAPSIDLVAVSPDIDDTSCPESVDLLVQLQNISEGIAESDVAVTFYNGDPKNGGTSLGTARSVDVLEPGSLETVSLQWVLPPVGETTIYIKADDIGNGKGEFEETNEGNNVVSFDVSVCEELQDPDANSISGEVIDAVTGERLSNVVVDLHISENGEPGTVVASFRTNYEGIFIFRDLDPRIYIITGKVSGYADGERVAILTKNAVLEHQDLVLSPVLKDDAIRIVLTWGQNPEDLEAHLTAPNPDGCRHHCFYWNQETPGANLDLDDRHSFGPETITITDLSTGTYRYYVHNFTNRTNLNNYYLSYYGAEVKIYLAGKEEPLIFKTPENRYTRGTVWHVFDIDGDTGEIIPVNKFTHQVEPGQIDFPRITSGPSQYAYWGVPYTYQIKAEDPDDDILTYTLLQGPKGMSIDPDTGLVEWTPLGIPDYKNLVSVKVSDGRCGEDTQSFYVYEYSTPAASFAADPCSAYNENGDITLTWNTSYAATVLIDQGIGEVEASGSITIPSPEFPKVYTLTAFNDAAAITRKVPAAVPSPGISVSPYIIEPTHTSTLSWNCGCAVTCEIDQGIGKVSGTGSIVVSPMETTTYTITTSNAVGQRSRAATLTVSLPGPPAPAAPPAFPVPTISFSGFPSCDWSPGIPITLNWSASNANNCEITPDIGQVDCNGAIEVNPEEPGTYTFVARGDGGIRSGNFTYPPAKPVTYRRLGVTPSGYVRPGDEVTLSWSTDCADIVTITGTGSDGIVDSVDEVVEVGNQLITVLDDLPYYYTLTATNEWGTTSYSIGLNTFPPRGTFTTDDSVIKVGESAVLHWTSTDADKCTITPGIGEVDCNGGSVSVTPDNPTRYYLNLEGPGGTYSYSLYINFVPPDVDIQATPETIKEGEPTTLSWVFSNATSCSIDNGIGEIQLGETLDVTPLVTTTYKITAIGPGGAMTDQIIVNVIPANPKPTATITVNPGVIWNGEASTLAWNTEYAASVAITPDIGAVAASGSLSITPTKDTTYTITATGTGGTVTSQVRITVLQYTPTATLTATLENIELGGSSLLTWTTEHAETVTITPAIGTVASSGSIEVSPDTTTTYQITAKGPGGTAIDFVTVSYPVPTVNLTSDPPTINYPGSTTLSWTSTNAMTATISPIIGTVDPSGTLDVSPLSNTTYTITATGPGGSVNESVTVTVTYPPPTASLTVEPGSIAKGESAQLMWSSENADSCSITPFIGAVDCNGSQTVTPDVSTTYTLTVTGPGGSVSKYVTAEVIHPVPTLNAYADPASIQPGESAILSWTTTDTNSVTIEPNIGTHPANGQVTVSPSATTSYTIIATGLGGTVSDTIIVTVQEPSPITLTITSPGSGETLDRPDVMVTGTVSHANGLETGVVVNGVVALIHNGEFAANDVPLQEGENTITVVANDVEGKTSQKSITINVQSESKRVELVASLESSLATMETDIRIDSNFITFGSTNLSWSGPGVVEYLESSQDSYTVRMTEPGLYFFTGTASDELNESYTDTMAILVIDRNLLNSLLQAKWNGLKASLSSAQIGSAVSYFHPKSRAVYQVQFEALSTILPQVVNGMGPLRLVEHDGYGAIYDLRTVRNNVELSFQVLFVQDSEGIWRIMNY